MKSVELMTFCIIINARLSRNFGLEEEVAGTWTTLQSNIVAPRCDAVMFYSYWLGSKVRNDFALLFMSLACLFSKVAFFT